MDNQQNLNDAAPQQPQVPPQQPQESGQQPVVNPMPSGQINPVDGSDQTGSQQFQSMQPVPDKSSTFVVLYILDIIFFLPAALGVFYYQRQYVKDLKMGDAAAASKHVKGAKAVTFIGIGIVILLVILASLVSGRK